MLEKADSNDKVALWNRTWVTIVTVSTILLAVVLSIVFGPLALLPLGIGGVALFFLLKRSSKMKRAEGDADSGTGQSSLVHEVGSGSGH